MRFIILTEKEVGVSACIICLQTHPGYASRLRGSVWSLLTVTTRINEGKATDDRGLHSSKAVFDVISLPCYQGIFTWFPENGRSRPRLSRPWKLWRQPSSTTYEIYLQRKKLRVTAYTESRAIISKILTWLGPSEFSSGSGDFKKHLRSYVPRTGEWLRKSEQYVQWYEHGKTALWINGTPGSDKSVVAATLINDFAL